jgi:glycosyltransferase involved in cell wall biosynthesis
MRVDLKTVWVVIPAYNEGSMIGTVVHSVRRAFANVVVVDDASADHTGPVAQSSGAHVVRHPINLGQGAALQTGFEYALQAGASHIVTFDADGQHHIEDVALMLERLDDSGADLALGSRFLGTTSGMKQSRRWLLRAAIVFTLLTTGLKLSDCHNGLRVLTAGAARKLTLRQNRMAHASEILAKIRKENLRFVEVPVTISYTDYSRQKGQSFMDAFAICRDLFAMRLMR